MASFLNPEKVFNELELQENMTAADFGCGAGGWAIPLAKRLKEGRVYAIDILEEPLSALKSKMETEKILNIEPIYSNIEKLNGSTLPDSYVDLVLITNLLFQAEDKKRILAEAKRILKNQGIMLIVDWKTGISVGPENKISQQEIQNLANELDFKFKKEFSAGAYHYCLIFIK